MPIAAERRISPVVPSPSALPESADEHATEEERSEEGRRLGRDPCLSLDEGRAPEHDRELDGDDRDEKDPGQPEAGRQPAVIAGPRFADEARTGAQVESDDHEETERRDESETPRQSRSGGRGEHDRADESRHHRPDVGAGHAQARQPPARATEQRVGVAEECPRSETDQQRRAECRRERRSEGKADDRDSQGGDPRAADTDLAEPPIEGGRDDPRQDEPDRHRARVEPDLGVAQSEVLSQVGRDGSDAVHDVADGRDRGVRRPRVAGVSGWIGRPHPRRVRATPPMRPDRRPATCPVNPRGRPGSALHSPAPR